MSEIYRHTPGQTSSPDSYLSATGLGHLSTRLNEVRTRGGEKVTTGDGLYGGNSRRQ